jgi:competence protein ComEC
LAHLLSISGVHMSLLAAAVFFVIRRGLALVPFIALRLDTKKLAAWAALGATALYVLISGLSVPAQRSFLMIGVVLIAILLDRTAISLRTIAWAALALMAIYPEAVIGASFQMSFMAVLALIALAEYARLNVRWRGTDGEFQIFRALAMLFLGLVATDIAASGSTALYAIYHFNRFPTYSMASNFLAGPITGLWVMPWGLIAMLAMPFGLDQLPLQIMGKGVALVNAIARTVGGWPGAQVHVPPMSAVALTIGSLGLLVLCLWRGRLRFVGLVLFAVAVTQPWLVSPPDVLMNDGASVVAISDANGHVIIQPGKSEKFTREVWSDRYGASTTDWAAATSEGLRCDSEGCILTRAGQKILIAFTPVALAEDCADVDATVSFIPARAFCRGTPHADLFDVRRRGPVALRATVKGVEFRYALDRIGDRRWSPLIKPVKAAPEPDETTSTGAADLPADPAP